MTRAVGLAILAEALYLMEVSLILCPFYRWRGPATGELVHLTSYESAASMKKGMPVGWVNLRAGRSAGMPLLWAPLGSIFARRVCFFAGPPQRAWLRYNLGPAKRECAVVVTAEALANAGMGQAYRRLGDGAVAWRGDYQGPGRIVPLPAHVEPERVCASLRRALHEGGGALRPNRGTLGGVMPVTRGARLFPKDGNPFILGERLLGSAVLVLAVLAGASAADHRYWLTFGTSLVLVIVHLFELQFGDVPHREAESWLVEKIVQGCAQAHASDGAGRPRS